MAAVSFGITASAYNRLTDPQKLALLKQKREEGVRKFGGSIADWDLQNPLQGEFGNMLIMENKKILVDNDEDESDALVQPGSQEAQAILARNQTSSAGRGGSVLASPLPQVGDPIPPTREEILELFTLGPDNGGWTRARVISELDKLGFPQIQINTMLAGVRQPPTVTTTPDPFFPNRQGTGIGIPSGIPGGRSSFQEQLDRLDAVGGRRGVFDALTNAFTSGLSNVGQASVGSRFAPLEASFLTNEGLQGLNTGQATSFEAFLRGNPQSLSPQDLLGRLGNIGSRVNAGEDSSFLDFFLDNPQARSLFNTAATTGINPAFRQVQQGALDRRFNQFLFENPFESIIGEIGRRGGKVFR